LTLANEVQTGSKVYVIQFNIIPGNSNY